jgi:hypothetical protein
VNQKTRAVRLAEVQLVEHRENYTLRAGRDEWPGGRICDAPKSKWYKWYKW